MVCLYIHIVQCLGCTMRYQRSNSIHKHNTPLQINRDRKKSLKHFAKDVSNYISPFVLYVSTMFPSVKFVYYSVCVLLVHGCCTTKKKYSYIVIYCILCLKLFKQINNTSSTHMLHYA